MTRIVYLPLDERPCNALFPKQIAQLSDLEFTSPTSSILGKKKLPASHEQVINWLEIETLKSDYLIVSIDMLVYGGIVPSRLHHLSPEECNKRLQFLAELKNANPKLKIYAFNLITRTPAYNSNEEEPDYYSEHGSDLFKYGWYMDKKECDMLTADDNEKFVLLNHRLPESVLQDFLQRRETNAKVNLWAIELAKQKIIDFLIIPLDDNAKFGFTSMEQRKLLYLVEEANLMNRVHIYPGADEIGCTLFARVFCEIKQYCPEAFVRYSSTQGPTIIPKYEDRSLNESIKCHLTAAGAFICDNSAESDFILMVNSAPIGQHEMAETSQHFSQRHRFYFSEINYREFAKAILSYSGKGKMIALADVATCNGGDTALMKLLSNENILSHISAYAAWNTSGNSLGTVIAHAIVLSYYRSSAAQGKEIQSIEKERIRNSQAFYLYRLIEDWGYQSMVREEIVRNHLANLGGDYFRIGHIRIQVYELIEAKLKEFITTYLQNLWPAEIKIDEVDLPWDRMFEVSFHLELEHK